MSQLPFISLYCATYKRPEMLRNAVACFEAQTYPADRRELIILDDAGQFGDCSGESWRLISTKHRVPTLAEKHQQVASQCQWDWMGCWDDDDVVFPRHLEDLAGTIERTAANVLHPSTVWSTYDQPFGKAAVTKSGLGYHSTWRFTRELFQQVSGYPRSDRLDFDYQFIQRLGAEGSIATYGHGSRPDYVYRWGRSEWNVSQAGEDGFPSLWQELGEKPGPFAGTLRPQLDVETKLLVSRYADKPDLAD